MARYIDADKLLEELQEEIEFETTTYTEEQNKWFNIGLKCAVRDVKSQPTADVVEVKHGEWKPIVKQDNYFEPPYCDSCKCSVCEYEIDVSETVYNYCPNCGAKMDGGKAE